MNQQGVKVRFQNVQLSEISDINAVSIKRDFGFSEIKYVDISSVGTGTLEQLATLSLQDAPSRAKRLVKNGSIIVATVRPNRRSFYYFRNPDDNVVVSTGFAVIDAKEGTDSRYLYYLLTNQNFTDYLVSRAKGAAYPAVDTETFKKARLCLPPLEIQYKYASILSSFDDLIANNTKGIKLLEQTAQLIYKEWFVNFRFPEHEEVESTDTGTRFGKIPAKWPLSPFSEVVRVNPQISFPKNKEHRFVTMGDLSTGTFVYIPDEKVKKAGKKFGHKDTLFARITPCLENGKGGYVRLVDEDEIVFGSTEFIVLREKVLPSTLVYLITRDERFRKRAQKSMVGASGRQRVQEKCFDSYLFPVAPKPLLDKFEAICEPIFNGVYNLSRQNRMLAKVRDFLLPHLIKQ